MQVKWTSFPYRAEFPDPALEFADRVAGADPPRLCQTERHVLSGRPAAYLEVFYTNSGDDMTIHRAWLACTGCHAKLGAEYEHVGG